MRKLLTAGLFLSLTAFAHEGHDHGPSAVQPPKGGVIRSLETVHLELLSKGNLLEIYTYEPNLKSATVAKYPATLTITLPKKKAEAVSLVDKGDHWEANYDAKGAHRYTVELAIKQGGHADKVKWVVEPRKR